LEGCRPVTMEEAKQMPHDVSHLSNEALYILAESGHREACCERLVRHVMTVDGIEWLAARERVREIDRMDRQNVWLATAPYKLGIFAGASAAIASVPLVFHLPTVEFVNRAFITTDVPEPEDLQTCWEVGAWAWNWMEPPLGVASFVILAMQLVRAQMQNMELKPYTDWARHRRAKQLVAQLPQYKEDILEEFSLSNSMSPVPRPRTAAAH